MKNFTIQRFSGLNGGKAEPFYNKKNIKKVKARYWIQMWCTYTTNFQLHFVLLMSLFYLSFTRKLSRKMK